MQINMDFILDQEIIIKQWLLAMVELPLVARFLLHRVQQALMKLKETMSPLNFIA